MILGIFGFGKGKKKEATQTEEPNPIEILRQEKQDLEERLAQAQTENQAQQTEYNNLKEEHEKLEKAQQSILKTAEAQVQKEAAATEEEIGERYMKKFISFKQEVRELEKEKQKLDFELKRKLNEFGRYKRKTSTENTKLKSEIDQLKERLENKERQYQKYIQGLPKIEERLKEISEKRYELLMEGDIVTATIYEKIEEERRENGYKALGPSGEILYVRTQRVYALPQDIEVVVKSLPVAEARIMDNPDVELKVGMVLDNIQAYDRTQEGLSAICKGGKELIIKVGEHISRLGSNTKVKVVKEIDGVFYAKRL